MDINSPHTVDRYAPDMANAYLVQEDCEKHLYCGMPYFVPVLTMIWKTHWLPGPEPHLLNPVNMTVLSKENIVGGQRITIQVSGTIQLYISCYTFIIHFFLT